MDKIAMAVAALGEPHPGGFVEEAYVRKGKKEKFYKKMDHMLVILENNYDKLKNYMSRLFILLSKGIPYIITKELKFCQMIGK